jgi:hypothetical protein
MALGSLIFAGQFSRFRILETPRAQCIDPVFT